MRVTRCTLGTIKALSRAYNAAKLLYVVAALAMSTYSIVLVCFILGKLGIITLI